MRLRCCHFCALPLAELLNNIVTYIIALKNGNGDDETHESLLYTCLEKRHAQKPSVVTPMMLKPKPNLAKLSNIGFGLNSKHNFATGEYNNYKIFLYEFTFHVLN